MDTENECNFAIKFEFRVRRFTATYKWLIIENLLSFEYEDDDTFEITLYFSEHTETLFYSHNMGVHSYLVNVACSENSYEFYIDGNLYHSEVIYNFNDVSLPDYLKVGDPSES